MDDFEKEMKELNGDINLPEAPVSITVKGYYKGFSVLITKRNAEGKVEPGKIIEAVDNLITRGFKPSWNDATNNGKVQPTLMTKPCATEGCQGTAALRKGISAKTNKPWSGWFCDVVKEHVNWEK